MINIAIDGIAGSGKSSLAKCLSKNLNLKIFNTGAVYRAITCEYIRLFGSDTLPTPEIMKKFLKDLKVEVSFIGKNQIEKVNGIDYTNKIREEIVSVTTPKVAGTENLRKKVRQIQRDFAKKNNCIMEGRDIGRTVLKNAQVKFFVVASVEKRAERRLLQNEDKNLTFEKVKEDIERRDKEDREREHGTMIPAEDAIIIDSSNETLEETTARCQKIIEEKLKKD